MYPYLIFDLYFKVTMPILDLKWKNDCVNTCNKIHVRNLTLTFISRSYLGLKPKNKTKPLKIFSSVFSSSGRVVSYC
jgi:hypothetical protein